MRYYSISIPQMGEPFPARYDGNAVWGSHKNGTADPGAQQVEIHIDETKFNLPTQDSVITVHGVSWDQIRHTDQLIGKAIRVLGGMAPGLPLATIQSQKRGLLMSAVIFRAWGNWIGTDMSIGMSFQAGEVSNDSGGSSTPDSPGDSSGSGPAPESGSPAMVGPAGVVGFRRTRISSGVGFRSIDSRPYARGASVPFRGGPPVATPTGIGDIGQFSGSNVLGAATSSFGGITSSLFGGGSDGLKAPLNLIHNMLPNMPMASAIQETLGRAFSQGSSTVGISDALKFNFQDAGMYQNMTQYANYIQKASQSILGIKNYLGVNMSSKGEGIRAWDGTKVLGWGRIEYWELIGQPTWININMVQVKCMMRGDLQAGDHVTLPATIFALAPSAIAGARPAGGSPQRNNVSIPGYGIITHVLHIGDFRNPDGVGWSTTYDVYVPAAAWGDISSLPGVGTPPLGIAGGVPGLPGSPSGPSVPPPSFNPTSTRLMSRPGTQRTNPGILVTRRGVRVN